MDNRADRNGNNAADRSSAEERNTLKKASSDERILSYSPRFEKENAAAGKGSSAGNAAARKSSGAGKASRSRKNNTKPVYYGTGAQTGEHPKKKHTNKKKKPIRNRPSLHNTEGNKAAAEENYKKLQHERNIAGFRRVLIIFAVLLIILFGLYGGYRLTTVREIIITGSEKYDSCRITDLCGIQTGHNIFSYNLADISEKISAIPELTVITVKKHFPDTIEITVTDHTPRAAIPSGNGTFTIIDSEGFVMSIGREDTEGLILIKGLTSTSFKPGKHITNKDNPNLRSAAALEFIGLIDSCGMQDIAEGIDVSNISCVKLILKNDFTAVLGTYPEAADNLDKAKKAYEILLPRYPAGGIINVFDNTTLVDFTPNED